MRQYMTTLKEEDVGRSLLPMSCPFCGAKRPIPLGAVIGRVQARDVGKQVFDVDGVIQVESDAQRDKRLRDNAEWSEP